LRHVLVVLASGTCDPAENCGHIQLYVYVHAGAFGFSGACCCCAHGGHENPETLVTYLETVQGHAAW
jgi:hypothetical protein